MPQKNINQIHQNTEKKANLVSIRKNHCHRKKTNVVVMTLMSPFLYTHTGSTPQIKKKTAKSNIETFRADVAITYIIINNHMDILLF